MKFRNLFNHRLMNEAEDFSADGGGGEEYIDNSESTGDDEVIFGESWEDALKDSGLDPAKYGLAEEDEVETEEDDSQGSEDGKEAGQDTDEKNFLDRLNSIGLVHNENPFQVGSVDEAKNLIQMGRDYTQKTQALSDERKVWESEKTRTEEELNGAINEFNETQKALEGKLQELQQFKFALDHLQKAAPDVFHEVQAAYEDVKTRFSNPIVEQQMAAMRAELAEAKKGISERESKLVVDEFEREFSGLSTLEQSLKELGINVDKNLVKNEWVKTGLPVKQVVGSLYFEHVAKAQASKAKVQETKKKIQTRPTGSASASRPGKKIAAIPPGTKGMALTEALWKRHVG